MKSGNPAPKRFVGLDVHKHYLIAVILDEQLNELVGPKRVESSQLNDWAKKVLTPEDAVVLEMTTNTWELYDLLEPHAHSVTVVHPPHVALITRSRVMTDKIAARALARLHAKGLLVGIWVPPERVRDLRALIALRRKMRGLSTQAKNRLHSLLHSENIALPDGDPFTSARREWWLSLPLPAGKQAQCRCNLETLLFANEQIALLEAQLTEIAAKDERIPLLVQLPGVALVNAQTILAAIGDIERFPSAKQLVGYAGLGASVHDSGMSTRTGRITKAGRRDLRTALVEAAQIAANHHPYWKEYLAHMEPRLGRKKTVVAIARKLLISVWHILTRETADRHADLEKVVRSLVRHAYCLGKEHRAPKETVGVYVRKHLDRMGIGQEMQYIPRDGNRRIVMPPSTLG